MDFTLIGRFQFKNVRVFMALSNKRFSRTVITSSLAVAVAVGICSATLVFLRPWPTHDAADAITTSQRTGDADASRATLEAAALIAPVPALSSDAAAGLPAASAAAQNGEAPAVNDAQGAESAEAATGSPGDPIGDRIAAIYPDPDITGASGQSPAQPQAGGRGRMSKAEADEALKPLLAYAISDDELKTLKETVRLIQREEFPAARQTMAKLTDQGAKKLAQWYYYRTGAYDTSAEEIIAFRDSHALWPDRDDLEQRAEEALLWREENPRKVLAWFAERRPVSGAGKAALGIAMMATGKPAEGQALVRAAWREHILTPAIEKRLRDTHAEVLRPQDHKARLDWLLIRGRKSDLKAIDRMLPLVDKKWEKPAQASIAMIKGDKNAGTLLGKLEGDVRTDPTVMLARIQWARRNDKNEEVWELLRAAPQDKAALINPANWWDHRGAHVRLALNSGNPKLAYTLARGYGGDLPAEDLSDAEFLSGWIALRFLNEPKAAHKHLSASAAAGGLPKHRARANYWLARAELALGNKRGAMARFAESAQYTHTFYGQLSRQIAEPRTSTFAMRPYARPTKTDIRAFTRSPVLLALAAANKAEFSELVSEFLHDLARQITSAPEMTLACELAQRITGPHRAVRMAKIAMNRGFPVEPYAYPDVLPDFKAISDSQATEEALINALTRQESEFNPTTVSSAGAVGLMQLLPSTAKEVAKANDIKFDKKKLLSDSSYNLSLGTAFLHRLISNYDGSYIMALAAYNAGPGRVRQWVEVFGDPRSKKVDPVDWIERIPFAETREYVLKIMESAQVYRARLGRDSDALRLVQDLHRGRPDEARAFLEAGMH